MGGIDKLYTGYQPTAVFLVLDATNTPHLLFNLQNISNATLIWSVVIPLEPMGSGLQLYIGKKFLPE